MSHSAQRCNSVKKPLLHLCCFTRRIISVSYRRSSTYCQDAMWCSPLLPHSRGYLRLIAALWSVLFRDSICIYGINVSPFVSRCSGTFVFGRERETCLQNTKAMTWAKDPPATLSVSFVFFLLGVFLPYLICLCVFRGQRWSKCCPCDCVEELKGTRLLSRVLTFTFQRL